MRYWQGIFVAAVLCAGCVQRTDVAADARLHQQAQAAFDAGEYRQARRLIAQADRHYVPQAELWRRTLELRLALAEGTPQGELQRLFMALAEQRKDWSVAERADASLTLAETLRPDYAQDLLREADVNTWPPALRTRYNLLMSRLQGGKPALRDDTVVRWRLAIRGLYDAGNLLAAAREADKCAAQTGNTEAALIAARLYAELGNNAGREAALTQACTLSPSADVRAEAAQIRALPAGTPANF